MMHYLRRFLAQMVDGVIITLIGVIIFSHSEHSPLLRGEGQWSITCRPGFSWATGLNCKSGPEGFGISIGGDPQELIPQGKVRLWQERKEDGSERTVSYQYDARWGLMVLYGLYYTLFTGLMGWTPGKRLLGLRVVGISGGDISVLRSLGRWIAYFPSWLLYVGLLWIFVDRNNRAWHDWLGGTQVVDLEKEEIDDSAEELSAGDSGIISRV